MCAQCMYHFTKQVGDFRSEDYHVRGIHTILPTIVGSLMVAQLNFIILTINTYLLGLCD